MTIQCWRRWPLWLLGSLSMGLLSMGSVAGGGEQAAFEEAIRARYEIKEQAFAAADAEPILNHFYTADVVSVDHEGHSYFGRSELRPLYEELVQGATVRVESLQSRVSGELGWDWANFHVTPKAEGQSPFTFKILFLWERIDGEWWCAGDMFLPGEFDSARFATAD